MHLDEMINSQSYISDSLSLDDSLEWNANCVTITYRMCTIKGQACEGASSISCITISGADM